MNVIQTAYQLVVKYEDGTVVWDTSKIASDSSSYIEYSGSPLKGKSRYEWFVTVWDNKGNTDTACASFETAILDENDWKAKWAESVLETSERTIGFGNQPPATMFRKGFSLNGKVAKARLYVTSHGAYRLTINGIRPDDRELAPEFTKYSKYLCYQTYDVSTMLENGDNALGMYVGDGWYCCPNQKSYVDGFRPLHAVLFQLEIEYGFNGREEWCACFVSWCADQCGLIESGAVPKFASCPAGVEWFRSNGKWKENPYSPAAGTIIFFDWNGDGVSDHVGIVEKCENGRVYTVEGNSGDAVRQEIYLESSASILGYGVCEASYNLGKSLI